MGYNTPLINNLKIKIIFKNKAKEEGVGITDFIIKIVQVLREDLYWIRISAWEAELMEPVKLWDKG